MLVVEKFLAGLGHADPELNRGFSFEGHNLAFFWDELYGKIKAGWFLNRYLCLFGEGVRDFDICLNHWSFLIPDDNKDRWVIGRNAYGALVVIEEPLKFADVSKIGILDTLTVSYKTSENMTFMNLISYWLPKRHLQPFMSDDLYQTWQKIENQYLQHDQILAIKTPLSLQGEMKIENFQIENIFQYFKSTGLIYKDLPIQKDSDQ